MEIKKSYKADLEHRRPLFFVAALFATFAFIAVSVVIYATLVKFSNEDYDSFDDESMDLDLRANEQDDMIAAALPEEPAVEEKKEESSKINKVEETTEIAPEQLDDTKTVEAEGEDDKEPKVEEIESKTEVPPINLNEGDPEALRIVAQLPEYPGGMVAFMKWLTANLKYPQQALQNRVQGKVMVSFIVEMDGSISNVKIMKGANQLLNQEALRVIGLMPKWTAGIENGKPCRSMVAIPVVFEI